MRTSSRSCFNNHTEPKAGCAGCHHAFHVITPGSVSGGRLIPPKVNGPLECRLCHDALHPSPVTGCTHCDVSFAEVVASAMTAAAPTRMELIGLRGMRWLVGWHARVLGWAAIISGRAFTDIYSQANGATNWGPLVISMFAVPGIQWLLDREIKRKERTLPQLSPTGEIVYGEPANPSSS